VYRGETCAAFDPNTDDTRSNAIQWASAVLWHFCVKHNRVNS
jgi:hypothetical protein